MLCQRRRPDCRARSTHGRNVDSYLRYGNRVSSEYSFNYDDPARGAGVSARLQYCAPRAPGVGRGAAAHRVQSAGRSGGCARGGHGRRESSASDGALEARRVPAGVEGGRSRLGASNSLKESYANEPDLVEGLGFAYYYKENWAQATTLFEQARGLREPGSALWNALGECYEKLGQPAKAKEAFQRSLRVDPEQDRTKDKLAALDRKEN